ncbi:MAG: tRNA (N6-isopentenyl adenosine(37)-C2)-methylthiotransferase MiaB [Rikenellaceae bacterium]
MDLQNIRPTLGGNKRKLYVETYGCQMNVGDTEIVVSILTNEGYIYTNELEQADIILLNTCSIRDNAEQKIWHRLQEIKHLKTRKNGVQIGIIGCMAERLKEQLIEKTKFVDIVAGPDSYRDLPKLLREAKAGDTAVNVLLSREETYADIAPVRLDENGVSSFISIMRGCNNMCTYCVVPYTRGAERSRPLESILAEVKQVLDAGYKEVTLLGQNVNSYRWQSEGESVDFADLIEKVALFAPELRIRYSTSHPKDISDKLILTMAKYDNICNHIHLPAQSGSSKMLKQMNRKYTREWYLERVSAIKRILPDCSITTDLIAGFCSESEEDHEQTLSLMREVGYEYAFMFKYSERPNTKAERTMDDDVDEKVKTRRLTEIINLQNELSLASNLRDIGKEFEVLIEGVSKKSEEQLFGRTPQNKVVIFDRHNFNTGDKARVRVVKCSSATLIGEVGL